MLGMTIKNKPSDFFTITKDMINPYGILFGGKLLSWMDHQTYYVAAQWFKEPPDKNLTTGSGMMDFKGPVYEGEEVSIAYNVVHVGCTSMTVRGEAWANCGYRTLGGAPTTAIRKVGVGYFTLVYIDNGKPMPIEPYLENEYKDLIPDLRKADEWQKVETWRQHRPRT